MLMTQTRLSTLHIVLDLRYLPKPLIKNHKKKVYTINWRGHKDNILHIHR